jgi:imidazolonepropionase-like amidohydrolase
MRSKVSSAAAALAALLGLALAGGCARSTQSEPPSVAPRPMPGLVAPEAPWKHASEAEWFAPQPSGSPILIRGARILIGDARVIEKGFVLLEGGKIRAVGPGDRQPPSGGRVIEAAGKVVTPGLIDTHSHLGVYPVPVAAAHADGNEATAPVTAEVRAVDAFWPQDPGIERAVAGGVTTIQALPGSANLIGGRAVTLKLRRATSSRAMHFEGAPDGLKMACGENPKRVYGERKAAPSTRMGNLAGQRAAFWQAKRLREEWRSWRVLEEKRMNDFAKARAEIAAKRKERELRSAWCAEVKSAARKRQCDGWLREWDEEKLEDPRIEDEALPPERNLALETLAAALEGRVLVHVHCYRADDMLDMLALADEVGFKIRSFHHALEAYKIADVLTRRSISVSTWADWWGFKLEAYDGIPENIALIQLAGGIPIVHTDSAEGIQRMNQEAAKALWSGRHAGLSIAEEIAIRWVTLNPAWALGIDQRVGTLEVGKDADVVIWSQNPLSVYARAEQVFIDGALRWDAARDGKPDAQRSNDFEAAP